MGPVELDVRRVGDRLILVEIHKDDRDEGGSKVRVVDRSQGELVPDRRVGIGCRRVETNLLVNPQIVIQGQIVESELARITGDRGDRVRTIRDDSNVVLGDVTTRVHDASFLSDGVGEELFCAGTRYGVEPRSRDAINCGRARVVLDVPRDRHSVKAGHDAELIGLVGHASLWHLDGQVTRVVAGDESISGALRNIQAPAKGVGGGRGFHEERLKSRDHIGCHWP